MKAVLKPKRGVFLEIWIQFSSLKTKKTQKSQSSALSRELCITILSAPSLITCLGDFLASYCISLCLSQHSSSSPENAAITQSIWNWERERKEGRQKSAFQHTTTICTLPRINNRTKQICLETAPPHAYSVGNQEPKLAGQPWSQRAGSPVLCFVELWALHYLTHRAEKEYRAGVKWVSTRKQDAAVPALNTCRDQVPVIW